MENNAKVLGWGAIITTMVVVGVVVGLVLGLMSRTLGLSTGATTGGVGASMGVVGALLVARRRAALDQQKNGRL
jgi:TRAP-type mannitol/chloroaromatic compound transport system permease large subunit